MSEDERSGLDEHRGMDRGTLLKRLAVGGAALSVPTLAAAQTALAAPNAETANVFPKHPKWKFAFINHVTTNPFFVPTQYGAADACDARRLRVHVDGLDEGRRRRDDQRLQRGDQRQGRRHRRLRRRQGRVRGPDQAGAREGHPRRSPTTPTARGPGAKARMAYIGQALYESGLRDGPADRDARPEG